jgi:hypothetical protein
MENLRDEHTNQISPTVGLRPPPKKQTKGKKHNSNMDILENPNQLTCDGG